MIRIGNVEVIRMARRRTIKDPPTRGKLTRSEIRRAVEKVVHGRTSQGETATLEGTTTFKVGRDTKTGRFIPVKVAQRRKSTAVVETIKRPAKRT
jgi:hypothetical protein